MFIWRKLERLLEMEGHQEDRGVCWTIATSFLVVWGGLTLSEPILWAYKNLAWVMWSVKGRM